MKKSWVDKLQDKPTLPKILKLEKGFPCYNALHKVGVEAGDDVVLVNPSEVLEIMQTIPKGKLITIVEICQRIALNRHVKGCCSLTTGIFIMTAANAAVEAVEAGGDFNIPYWRTLKSDGYLNDKYPGGQEAHKRLLESEGFRIIPRGKKYQVDEYHKFLAFS
jgi:alkylated DNA nucleotide flippase Atl1